MKYVMMFVETPEYARELASLSPSERDAAYEKVGQWFAEHGAKITHSTHLQPAHTATTVRLSDGRSEITDGPFIEGKEIVSGFAVVEVADLDEALAMVRTWPACPIVELRPATA
jgi:hypothetical protein